MQLSVKDWVALWHMCYPILFEIYIAVLVPTMFICSRRLMSKRSTIAGLVLSAASFVVVMWLPIGAIAWLIIEGLLIGEQSRYSLWNGISFAPLMALGGALIGAMIVRFIFRERIGKKGFALLYAGNLVSAVLAIAAVLVWVSMYPPQVIA
jgi:hypothetical protein